ncbi:helix-turn-helix transcriptional regulator [Escherichia coli]|uniref:helix-turn-helix transcriptional regulator n=1 Tax=Escherichia coli TaxID=562 RepID=UPI000BDF6301|nr:AlpA family phage regulatory protein [Escherichia coli]AWS34964.1 AlpA family phage regulatory protein [Escherichia coli]
MVTFWGNYEGISQSKAWIYRLIKEQRFPQSVKIGSRSIAFIESEIEEWINQRIAESRGEVA